MPKPERKSKIRWMWLVFGLVMVTMAALIFVDFDGEESLEDQRQGADLQQDHSSRMKQLRLAALARAMHGPKVPTVQVSGTVKDTSGTPISGAQVFLVDGARSWKAVSDSLGNYTIDIPPGSYGSYARSRSHSMIGSEHYVRHSGGRHKVGSRGPFSEMAPAVIALEDMDGLDFVLTQTATVKGRVLDLDGDPVQGASVVAWAPGDGLHSTRLVSGADSAVTSRDGEFQLQAIEGFVKIAAYHSDFAGLQNGEETLMTSSLSVENGVELTLVRGCRIAGRVVDSLGNLAGDGAIELSTTGETGPLGRFQPAGSIEKGGRFSLDLTREGTFYVKAWPWKSPGSEPQAFDCEENSIFEDVEFVIPDEEPDIEGTLVTVDGEPIAGAYVDISPLGPHGYGQQERTDSEGRWAVYAMPAGPYHISAYVEEEGVAFEVVTSPSTENKLVLSGLADVEGTVVGVESGFFTFEAISCFDDSVGMSAFGQLAHSSRVKKMVPVTGGRFKIEDLPACNLEANVNYEGSHERVLWNISPGNQVEQSVDLRSPEVRMRELESALQLGEIF